jgi:hypothetical protein
LASVSGRGTPAVAATVVAALAAAIIAVCGLAFGATATDTFAWSGTIGTLILLVIYLLATLGAARLVYVQRKLRVPWWQIVFPIGAIALLGYTVYVNVVPYPTSGAAKWFPVIAGGILVVALVFVLLAPRVTRRVGAGLAKMDGGV